MLQFITHPTEKMTILEEIEKVVAGGCKWVQLRMKDASREEIIATARNAKDICKAHDCILVIDDHVDIAKELELDGVHLGKNDTFKMEPAIGCDSYSFLHEGLFPEKRSENSICIY